MFFTYLEHMGNIINFEGFDRDKLAAEAISEEILQQNKITPDRAYFTYHDIARIAFRAALEGLNAGSGTNHNDSYDVLSSEVEGTVDAPLKIPRND